MNLLEITAPKNRNYIAALWAGFWGGNISSFVKWGTEIPFPPRTPDRISPPKQMIQDWGFDVNAMVYNYSEHIVNWGVVAIHHVFSIVFALFYCMAAEIFPKIKLGQGLVFSLLVTIMFHGVLLPMNGWAPQMWELPMNEVISEIFGHAVWMWTIEIFRRDIRNRITKRPDAEFC